MRNDATDAADCSIVVEDPASGVTVDPPAFKLRGHEVRTVTVLFSEKAQPTRDQRVVMKLRNDAGVELASFEHPLLIAALTDCSITLEFGSAIVENNELKGFVVNCLLRSQSEGTSNFNLSVTPHPAMNVAEPQPLTLEPGASGTVAIPVRWNATTKDEAGLNHPRSLEVVVPVSNGRRTCRLAWDTIEPKLSPSAWKSTTPRASEASKPLPAPASKRSEPAPTPKPLVTGAAQPAAISLLMLGSEAALKCLPNPQTPQINGHARSAAVATAATLAPPAPASSPANATPTAPSEPVELTLFGNTPVAPVSKEQRPSSPPSPSVNGAKPAVVTAAPPPPPSAAPPIPTTPPATPAAITPVAAPTEGAAAATIAPPAAPVQPQAKPAPAGLKLTPYASTRWEAIDNMASSVVAPPKTVKPSQPEQSAPSQPPEPKTEPLAERAPMAVGPIVRVRTQTASPKRAIPAGVIIGFVAVGTLAAAAILFRPNNPAQHAASGVAIASAAPQNVSAPAAPAAAPMHKVVVVGHVAPKPASVKPVAHSTATPRPTRAPTSAPRTPAPSTPAPAKPAAAAPVHKAASWSAPVPRPQPAQASSQSVVALGGIEAYYGPRGHAVRVLWSAAEQASATVQLINDRGTIVSATSVRGGRQSALLYLPRRFHGALTVQVSSVGRLGERVAETTSLPPFGE